MSDNTCHICGGGCVPIACEVCGKDKQECEAHCSTMSVYVRGSRNRNRERWYLVLVPPAFFPKSDEDFSAFDFAWARTKRAGINMYEATTKDPKRRAAAVFTDDGKGLHGLWN